MTHTVDTESPETRVVPVMLPLLPQFSEVRHYLTRCDESRVYSNHGPLVRQLEARYSDHFGVSRERVVAVSSGTVALQALLASYAGTTVTVPAFTFPATLHAAAQAGKNLVIADVSRETAMCTDSARGGLSLVAIPFGGPIDWSVVEGIQADGIVIDAAASTAMISKSLAALPPNAGVAISLHATKVLGAGEGGIAVCGSSDQANFVRRFINFGFAAQFRESMHAGINGKMSEITAAYALAALDNFPEERREWLAHSQKMWELTSRLGVADRHFDPRWVSPYWVIRTPPAIEARVVQQVLLNSYQISSRVWWTNCAQMEPFRRFSVDPGAFESAEYLEKHLLGLPRFRGMTDAEFGRVENALLRTLT